MDSSPRRFAVACCQTVSADLARDYAHRAVSRIIHPSGMIRDAGGIEVSYGGIGIQYLVKGALNSRWPELTEALTRKRLSAGQDGGRLSQVNTAGGTTASCSRPPARTITGSRFASASAASWASRSIARKP